MGGDSHESSQFILTVTKSFQICHPQGNMYHIDDKKNNRSNNRIDSKFYLNCILNVPKKFYSTTFCYYFKKRARRQTTRDIILCYHYTTRHMFAASGLEPAPSKQKFDEVTLINGTCSRFLNQISIALITFKASLP